jgi:hypothetical protein
VLADPRLAETAQCAACHQFAFPARADRGALRYHPGRPLQDTVAEWRASRYADRACQACHMPRVGPPGSAHASHAFAVLGDPAALARAVEVTARAVRRGRQVDVALTLTAREIGHAFPTGDMFRRAVITVRAGAASRVAVLTREFAPTITDDARGHLLGQVDDTRLPAPGAGPPVTRAITLDAPAAREAIWTLALDRLDPDDAAARGLELSQVRVPVAAGRVPIAR